MHYSCSFKGVWSVESTLKVEIFLFDRIFHFGINITIIAILWHNLQKVFFPPDLKVCSLVFLPNSCVRFLWYTLEHARRKLCLFLLKRSYSFSLTTVTMIFRVVFFLKQIVILPTTSYLIAILGGMSLVV